MVPSEPSLVVVPSEPSLAVVPSEPSLEVEVEVVPPCQTEYLPVLKAVGSAAYQSSD